MRFDPGMTREETSAAIVRDAAATWGEERLEELRAALDATAGAIWRIAQERLEPTDVEP
jgi:hypothetical protein